MVVSGWAGFNRGEYTRPAFKRASARDRRALRLEAKEVVGGFSGFFEIQVEKKRALEGALLSWNFTQNNTGRVGRARPKFASR